MVEQILESLVSIPSPYPFELPIVKWVEAYLRNIHFEIKRIPVGERYEIVATRGTGSESLLLFGHLDTVPIQGAETLDPHMPETRDQIIAHARAQGWDGDPYLPRWDKQRLYGSGASDMKAGVAAILAIAGALPESWFRNNRLKIALTVAEEHLAEGVYELVQTEHLRDVTACICTEIQDTPHRLNESLPGVETILLGRRGRMALEIVVFGKAAHAATPRVGVNAIEEASRMIKGLMDAANDGRLPLRKHEILPGASITPLSIEAGTSSLSVPSTCRVVFDRHMVPPETPDMILQEFTECIESIHPPVKYEIHPTPRPTPFLLPFVTSKDEPIVRMAEEAIKSMGKNIRFSGGNSVADENMIASKDIDAKICHGIPTIIMGCTGDNYHGANEWVDADSLRELCDALFRVCKLWDQRKEG
jgi:succinyl-diaminopimelate desuccinylase